MVNPGMGNDCAGGEWTSSLALWFTHISTARNKNNGQSGEMTIAGQQDDHCTHGSQGGSFEGLGPD